jgi:site-specific DNA recombinase
MLPSFPKEKGPTPMRAAIWLRVSTDMQVESDSPLYHEKRARAYAEGKDWEVIETYRLDAVSGKSVMEHPEAKRMINDIKRGHIQTLIFSKLARLARNTRELLAFSDMFQEAGANLVSLGESIDTSTSTGRLYFTIISALTQWEREEISARVAAAVPVRAKAGKQIGGAAPYGYKWQDGNLMPDAEEAPVRKLIYELWIKERRKKTVARTLNERGYRTRNGSLFSDTTIRRLIEDRTAKGVRLANYTRTSDRSKAWELKPECDWIWLPCEAIITPEMWEEANSLLLPKRSKPKGRPALHIFTGLTHCHCGGRMYVPSNGPHKYRCHSCNNKILATDLEALFHGELESFFVDDHEVNSHLSSMDEAISSKAALLDNRLSERVKLQKEMDKLYDLYQSDMIDKYGFGERYRPMSIQMDALSLEILELESSLVSAKKTLFSKEEIMTGARDLHSKWPTLSLPDKREIIETITQSIVIGIDEITINLLHTSSFKDTQKATPPHGFIAAIS